VQAIRSADEIVRPQQPKYLGDLRIDPSGDRADEVVQPNREPRTTFQHEVSQRDKLRELTAHQRVVVSHDDDLGVRPGGGSQCVSVSVRFWATVVKRLCIA
jgi:hypothetical protein